MKQNNILQKLASFSRRNWVALLVAAAMFLAGTVYGVSQAEASPFAGVKTKGTAKTCVRAAPWSSNCLRLW